GESLTLFSPTQVSHSRGLTPLLKSLLLKLTLGPQSKESLILHIWKYPVYHPSHHDHVVYQAVTSLRRLFNEHADWIETTEVGYKLSAKVTVRSSVPETAPRIENNPSKLTLQRLNYRQIGFLRQMKDDEFASVHEYRKKFKVSEITACRDLSGLFAQGFLLRVG